MSFCPWKTGDRVRFNHQLESGPTRIISDVEKQNGEWMVQVVGMSGWFAVHLFKAEGYPADSIVPPKANR